MNKSQKQKYFHCYATANDSRLYLKDIQNLMRIWLYASGFDKLYLFIAISKVSRINIFDRLFVKMVKKVFRKHPSVRLIDVFFKSNIGRDFSSYQSMQLRVKEIGNSSDYVLFQNRSAFGPYHKNWYKEFVQQFEQFESVALCGSTINFMDHPRRSLSFNFPHIQTYAFLTKIYFLDMFGNTFPGSAETTRLNVILNGEIELSQFFLKRNYKLTCIEWPNEMISNYTKPLMYSDVKSIVREKHYFYHRLYFKKNRSTKIPSRLWSYYFKFLLLSVGLK